MKKLLFLTLIFIASTQNTARDYEEVAGPAYNAKNGGYVSCSDRYVASGTRWKDDIYDDDRIPAGVSDCVDLQLWNPTKKIYYDRCCYVRFQKDGVMHAGCVGLSEENYLDTTITMKRMEDGDRQIWTRYGANSKIYQLDCFSSYIKNLSIASFLLVALFF
jgi:hypothetical protein